MSDHPQPYCGSYFIGDRRVSYQELQDYVNSTTRVGRTDRERYADHLSEMYSLEYLTQDEYGERSAAALQAKYMADLTTLVTDLPPILPKAVQPMHITEPCDLPHKKQLTHGASLIWSLVFLVLSAGAITGPVVAGCDIGNGGACASVVFGGFGALISAVATLNNLANRYNW